MRGRPPHEDERIPYQLRLAAGIAWRFLVVAAAIVVLAVSLAELRVVFLPVVLALFAAAVLAPAVSWLRRRKVPAALAAAAVLLTALALVGGAVAFFAPRVVDEFAGVGASVEDGVDEVLRWLREGPLEVGGDQLERWQEDGLEQIRGSAQEIVGGVLGGAYVVVELVAGLLLALVLLFFFLRDGERIWPWVVRLFPPRARTQVDEVGRIAWDTLGGYLRGVSVVAFVDALFIGLALWLIGVPLVLPLALLTFVGGFFPLVGAVTAGFAAAMVALVSEGLVAALLVVGAATLVQQLEGNLLEPLVVGRAVKLHAIAILLAVAAGAAIWGIAGAFLAVPLTAIVAKGASHLRSAGEPEGSAA